MPHLTLSLTISGLLLSLLLVAQPVNLRIAVRGTGQTTGHIANLSVHNPSDQDLIVAAGNYYIPATPGYQAYVVRIPAGTRMPAGETVQLGVPGFCVDVHHPPVPLGLAMTDFREWVWITDGPLPDNLLNTELSPLHPPTAGDDSNTEIVLVPDHIRPPFTPTNIPEIVRSSGFQRSKPKPQAGAVLTYPGTNTVLDGSIKIDQDPLFYAPLIVGYVLAIEQAVPRVQQQAQFTTPYRGQTADEYELLVQHVVWLVMARLSGATYTIDEFRNQLTELLVLSTGVPPPALPVEEEANFEAGVTDFWNTFTAVGLEAKVLQIPVTTRN